MNRCIALHLFVCFAFFSFRQFKSVNVKQKGNMKRLKWSWAVNVFVCIYGYSARKSSEKCRHSTSCSKICCCCCCRCCGGCHSFSYRLVCFLCVREFSVEPLTHNSITLQILSVNIFDASMPLSHNEISTYSTHKIEIIV